MFKFLKSKKGFTLTEIMTVVIILGILSAIAIPVFNVSLKAKKQEDCKNQRIVMTTTVREVMAGMVDNGKPQEEITGLKRGDVGEGFYDFSHSFCLNENPDDPEPVMPVEPKAPTAPLKPTKKAGESDSEFSKRLTIYYQEALPNYENAVNKYNSEVLQYELNREDYQKKYNIWFNKNKNINYALYFEKATIGDIRGGYRISVFDSAYKNAVKKAEEEKNKAALSGVDIKIDYNEIKNRIVSSYNVDSGSYKDGCMNGHYLKKLKLADVPVVSLLANGELPVCPFNEKDEKTGKYKYCYYIDCTGEVHCTCPECMG